MAGEKSDGKHGGLPLEVVFRNKLRAFVGGTPPLTKARELGIRYRRFHRWLTEGIKWPNHRSMADVQKLAKAMGLEDWRDLWRDKDSTEAQCEAIRRKVEELLRDEACRRLLANAVEYIQKKQLRGGEGRADQDETPAA